MIRHLFISTRYLSSQFFQVIRRPGGGLLHQHLTTIKLFCCLLCWFETLASFSMERDTCVVIRRPEGSTTSFFSSCWICLLLFHVYSWINTRLFILNMRIVGPVDLFILLRLGPMLRVCKKIEGNTLKHHRMQEQLCINIPGVPHQFFLLSS